MRSAATIFATLLAVLSWGTAARAQAIKKSTISGILTSRSVAVPNAMSVPIFTTPAAATSEFFILTEVCTTVPGAGNVTVSGGTFGLVVASSNDECTSYNPGITFPPAEALSCNNVPGTGSTEHCMITGVVGK